MCVSYRQQSANVGSHHLPEASTRCWSRGGHSSAGICWLQVVFFFCFNFFHDEETAEIPSQILLWHHPSHVARRMPGADSAPGLCWLRNVSSTGKSRSASILPVLLQPGGVKGSRGGEEDRASDRAVPNNCS